MTTLVLLVTNELCRRGSVIAITLSNVRGRRAGIPELANELRKIVYAAQYGVVLWSGDPTNLLFIMPSPLKSPTIDNMTSLTATFMINRFWHFARRILRRWRK